MTTLPGVQGITSDLTGTLDAARRVRLHGRHGLWATALGPAVDSPPDVQLLVTADAAGRCWRLRGPAVPTQRPDRERWAREVYSLWLDLIVAGAMREVEP